MCGIVGYTGSKQAALREANAQGEPTLGIVNVVGLSLIHI